MLIEVYIKNKDNDNTKVICDLIHYHIFDYKIINLFFK